MSGPWDVQMVVEAVGHDDAQVSVVPGTAGRSPHITVRTGPVLMHCLDQAAVRSAAAAWAAGEVRLGPWLPRQVTRRHRPADAGAAYPAGSIIFDGRQPWTLSAAGDRLTLTVGCLQVQVHDRIAFDTHARAWAQASALAVRLYPGRALPYAELLRQARTTAVRQAASRRSPPRAEPLHRPGRERP